MFIRILSLGVLALALAPVCPAAIDASPTALVKAGQSASNCGHTLTVNHKQTGSRISKFATVLVQPTGDALTVEKSCVDHIWLDVPAGHRVKLVNATFFGTHEGAFTTSDITLSAQLNNGGSANGTVKVNGRGSFVKDVKADSPAVFTTCDADTLLSAKTFIAQADDGVIKANFVRYTFEVQKCLFDD